MNRLHERIRYQIRETLCPVCVFQGADGACYAPDPDGCPILRNVDKIVDVVQTIHSDRMEPYIERLREVICAECHNQNTSGECRMRDKADCALDDYFGLVVEIVERELGRPDRKPLRDSA